MASAHWARWPSAPCSLVAQIAPVSRRPGAAGHRPGHRQAGDRRHRQVDRHRELDQQLLLRAARRGLRPRRRHAEHPGRHRVDRRVRQRRHAHRRCAAAGSTPSAPASSRSCSPATRPSAPRARGDWGGLIINGRAPVNIEGGEGVGRGRHRRLRRQRPERQQRHAALRPRRVRRRRVQPRQRAERHRVPGRRPRRLATSSSRCT